MDFYDVDFGFGSKSRAELDALADSGGVLGSTGYGYAMPTESAPHDGYSMRVIARCGMGNHGIAVLRGETPETRERIRVGRALALAKRYAISFDMADTILGTRCSYVHEDGVIRAALAEWDSPAWEHTGSMARYNSIRYWFAEFGVDCHGLSAPRLGAVVAICERLHRAFYPVHA
jgi:hypothetical protein